VGHDALRTNGHLKWCAILNRRVVLTVFNSIWRQMHSRIREDSMGLLMLRCPTTGRGFDAGVDTDETTFERLPDTISTARCPHCGQEHRWRPSDGRLLDALNDSKPYGGLPLNGRPIRSLAIVKIEPMLTEVCQLLIGLTIKLGSASLAEMPALIVDAKEAVRLVVRLASDQTSHLPPEEVAMLRAELVKIADALEAQIAGVVGIRWTELGASPQSQTKH
jgi:hypothetical protein